MTNTTNTNPSDLIQRARDGDSSSLSGLIHGFRPYLKLLARVQRDERLKAKLDDSDLVQEVSALAVRDFPTFGGSTEAEFAAWLRTITARVAAMSIRHFTMQRRDIQLERQLQTEIDNTSRLISAKFTAPDATPSERTLQRERAVLLAEALEELPDHYREVVILRDFEGLPIAEVAERMNRTPDAIRKISARAMLRIRRSLEGIV